MKNRVLICQMLPEKVTHMHEVSQALNNFNINIINTNYFETVISLVPVNIVSSIQSEIGGAKIEFVQNKYRNKNKILQYLNILIENFKIVSLAKSSSSIWYSNVNIQTLISCFILKFIYRKKVYNILTDYSPTNNIISFQYLLKILIDKLDGIITLSARTNIKHSNAITIAGIIPYDISEVYEIKSINNKDFLFSGALEKITGIDLALKVFSRMPHLTLIISGRGKEINMVHEYVSIYPNIKYLGFLEYNEYKKILSNLTYCLSFRNPIFPENNYNFPSKVLEYFCANKIVISTIKYPELLGFNYYYCEFDEAELMTLINEILNSDQQNNFLYTNNGFSLNNSFSIKTWERSFEKIENQQLTENLIQ